MALQDGGRITWPCRWLRRLARSISRRPALKADFFLSFTVTPIFTFTNVTNGTKLRTRSISDRPGVRSDGRRNWGEPQHRLTPPMGIPIVPLACGSAVHNRRQAAVWRHTGGLGRDQSTGYGCGQNNELHGEGSIGQQLHGTKPPNDCAQNSPPPPPPQPSPTPIPIGNVGAARAKMQPTTGAATISIDRTQALCVTTVQ
jgi:hypothetical protein